MEKVCVFIMSFSQNSVHHNIKITQNYNFTDMKTLVSHLNFDFSGFINYNDVDT